MKIIYVIHAHKPCIIHLLPIDIWHWWTLTVWNSKHEKWYIKTWPSIFIYCCFTWHKSIHKMPERWGEKRCPSLTFHNSPYFSKFRPVVVQILLAISLCLCSRYQTPSLLPCHGTILQSLISLTRLPHPCWQTHISLSTLQRFLTL